MRTVLIYYRSNLLVFTSRLQSYVDITTTKMFNRASPTFDIPSNYTRIKQECKCPLFNSRGLIKHSFMSIVSVGLRGSCLFHGLPIINTLNIGININASAI